MVISSISYYQKGMLKSWREKKKKKKNLPPPSLSEEHGDVKRIIFFKEPKYDIFHQHSVT